MQSPRVASMREAVRARPAMFFSNSGLFGLVNLFQFVMQDVAREARGGHCDTILITVDPDLTFTIKDNGRPFLIPTLGTLLTNTAALHSIRDIGNEPADILWPHCEMHVVNPACDIFCVSSAIGGNLLTQSFRAGIPESAVQSRPAGPDTGNTLVFRPDFNIFDGPDPDFCRRLVSIVRNWGYFLAGTRISYHDAKNDLRNDFYFPDGMKDCLEDARFSRMEAGLPCLHYRHNAPACEFEIAVGFGGHGVRRISFVNELPSRGGSHIRGLEAGLRIIDADQPFKEYLREVGAIYGDLSQDYICAMRVVMADPQYEGASKDILMSPEVEACARDTILMHLPELLERKPASVSSYHFAPLRLGFRFNGGDDHGMRWLIARFNELLENECKLAPWTQIDHCSIDLIFTNDAAGDEVTVYLPGDESQRTATARIDLAHDCYASQCDSEKRAAIVDCVRRGLDAISEKVAGSGFILDRAFSSEFERIAESFVKMAIPAIPQRPRSRG